MVRILFVAVLICGFIAGFMPRPVFLPDWRTPFEGALEKEDCAALERNLQIQIITNRQGPWFEIAETLEQRSLCGAKPRPNKDYNEQAAYLYKEASFFDRIGSTSYLAPRIQNRFVGRNSSRNPIINASLDRSRTMLFRCYRGLTAPCFGPPNYQLQAYALKNDTIPLDYIFRISLNQSAACARMLMSEAILMLNVASTPEDYETALENASLYGQLGHAAPETFNELIIAASNVPDDIKAQHPWEIAIIFRDGYIFDEIGCSHLSRGSLIGAIDCAEKSAEKIAEDPEAAAFAAYYAARARRLGWEDLSAVELAARATISPECYAAVIDRENEDANDRIDPRSYEDATYPSEFYFDDRCNELRPLE